MNTQDILKKFFPSGFDTLTEKEKRVVRHISEKKQISRNTNQDFSGELTFGQRLADRVASFGGSWTFILLFLGTLLCWVALNTFVLARHDSQFDPSPYILLNLILSMLASLQAPVIMMSQNRQAAKDRLDAAHDYEVNLKAELEIMGLHEKMDALRERQWQELILMQQKQIELLTQLLDDKMQSEQGSSRGSSENA